MLCHICRKTGHEAVLSSILSNDKVTRIITTELWCINHECLAFDTRVETIISILESGGKEFRAKHERTIFANRDQRHYCPAFLAGIPIDGKVVR